MSNKLTDRYKEKVIASLAASLMKSNNLTIGISQEELKKVITQAFNMLDGEEKDIEEEAREILKQYDKEFKSGSLSYDKMLEMVKKEILKKRGRY